MTLGFKRQFAPMVEDGSKTHSIREDLEDRWHPGVPVDAFVDPRQKTMRRLIPRTPCVKTERIVISQRRYGVEVIIGGVKLDDSEKEAFAFRDGFRKQKGHYFEEMMAYWKGQLPFKGKLIHWRNT
jgi:hypothetical protein